MADDNDTSIYPADFGWRYALSHTAWRVWRWTYYNPLTILFVVQDELVNVAELHPGLEWLHHLSTLLGVVVAQLRNSGRDYSIPIRPKNGAP